MYAGSARRGRAEATGGHVFELQLLQRALMQVVVAGISEISRAIISRKEESEKHESEQGRECFQLLVEGVGLQAVMGVKVRPRAISPCPRPAPAPSSRRPHPSPLLPC